jgi:hypothetical protein
VEPPSRFTSNGRVLRVFFDLGHDWPLWESGTDKVTMEPSDYGFSDELVALLIRWREAWISFPTPGASGSDHAASAAELQVLRALRRQAIAVIRREAPPGVEVQAD